VFSVPSVLNDFEFPPPSAHQPQREALRQG
jgi:hypothetical protein